jgi:hypothetical protein
MATYIRQNDIKPKERGEEYLAIVTIPKKVLL